MKHKIATTLIAAVMFSASTPAFSGGVPTIDAANLAYQVQQLLQMIEQLQQLKQQYEAMTGSSGYGDMGLDQAIEASEIIPGTWQDVVARQGKGEYGSRSNQIFSEYQTLEPGAFEDAHQGKMYKASTDASRAAMVTAESSFKAIDKHTKNLQALAKQIEKADTEKKILDLQARIDIERSFITAEQTKIQAVNLNLQGQMQNGTNQGLQNSQTAYENEKKRLGVQ